MQLTFHWPISQSKFNSKHQQFHCMYNKIHICGWYEFKITLKYFFRGVEIQCWMQSNIVMPKMKGKSSKKKRTKNKERTQHLSTSFQSVCHYHWWIDANVPYILSSRYWKFSGKFVIFESTPNYIRIYLEECLSTRILHWFNWRLCT